MIETQGKPTRAWSTRPHFAPKQRLTAHALNELLDAQLQREALLARGLHGHGVVFGLGVVADGGPSLSLSCGLALDRHGRMLFREEGDLHYDRLAGKRPEKEGSYVLSIHFAERRAEKPGCGPCGSEHEWIEQGVVFTLRQDCDDVDRRCPDIPDKACIDLDDYVCVRAGAHAGPVPPAGDLKWGCAPPGPLCRTDCGWEYDAEAGVPLARIRLCNIRGDADCGPLWGFEEVDNCCVRLFVSRTPLLLELIRGCHTDLPKVQELSWQDWTLADYRNEVAWGDFIERCNDSKGFRIRFTKAIDIRTIHPGSVFLTAIISDADNDYHDVRQIPLDPTEPIRFLDRKGHEASRIELNIYQPWKDNHVRGNYGSLFYRGGEIKLTIVSQLLRDSCGNMLDGRLAGHSPPGFDQSRPGGDFVALFRVAGASTRRRKRPTGGTPNVARPAAAKRQTQSQQGEE
jgi:hypothetical protein